MIHRMTDFLRQRLVAKWRWLLLLGIILLGCVVVASQMLKSDEEKEWYDRSSKGFTKYLQSRLRNTPEIIVEYSIDTDRLGREERRVPIRDKNTLVKLSELLVVSDKSDPGVFVYASGGIGLFMTITDDPKIFLHMLLGNTIILNVERPQGWLQYKGTVSTEFLEELAEQAGTVWPHFPSEWRERREK